MENTRRQQYLAAMGIESWMPHRLLPGAAAGRVIARHTPVAQVGVYLQPERAAPANASVSQSSSAARMLQDEALGRPIARSPVTPPLRPHTESVAAPSFKLAIYAWAPGLLVIDQVHDLRQQQLLVSNLLFALGHKHLQRTEMSYFDWPLPHRQNAVALSPHEMVAGILQRNVEQHDTSHMLLMGDIAVQQVLNVKSGELSPGERLDSSPLYAGVNIISTHSGVALLENPLLKAETWRHVECLKI